ncbi:fad binding domain-containing protein [Fusarium mundagurra]|uniref:Fad binding domain-containing protein n=1 Tax=Fusarium mundagurra TaxID=1567541 RepID=A0A8H5Z5K6_9HYPO|nr:fad binding domain-containing protein [Fusarium mundagurra]
MSVKEQGLEFVNNTGKVIAYFPANTTGKGLQSFTTDHEIMRGDLIRLLYDRTKDKRLLFTRRHSTDRVQAYLVGLNDSERVMAARKGGLEDEKVIFSELFGAVGWRSEELIKETQDSTDFYCEHMALSAYCPTATTGMGTTSSIVGAYVLAGEIQRHCSRDVTSKEIVLEALHTYEEQFRPFMKTVQDGIEKDKTYWHKMPYCLWH